MTPDPLDPDEQRAYRELDSLRRIQGLARKGCDCNCLCKQDDAMTTPLDIKEYE